MLCPMSTAPAPLEQVLHVLPFDQDSQAPSPSEITKGFNLPWEGWASSSRPPMCSLALGFSELPRALDGRSADPHRALRPPPTRESGKEGFFLLPSS